MGPMGKRFQWMVASLSLLGALSSAWAQGENPPPEFIQTLESGPKGSLAIRATLGTTDGRSAANAPVGVDLLHRGQSIRHIDAQLDDNAIVVIGDIPVGIGVRPLVQIEYAGVTYQEFGPEMSAQSPNGAIDVTVYDVTDDEPEWRVVMRQVMTSPSAQSVVVSETVVVENMGDRTWLGSTEVDDRGNRTSVRLTLPDRASNVQLVAGFHGWCCTTLGGRVLGIQMPLMPERVTYRFSYEVPVHAGGSKLEFAAPVMTSALSVYVPENMAQVSAIGLAPAGLQAGEFGPMRMFDGKNVPADQAAGVDLNALAVMATNDVVPVAQEKSSDNMAKILAGVGIAALVVIAGVVVIMKKPKAGGA